MIKKFFAPILLAVALLASCGKSTVVLPSVSGTKFEVLVVMDEIPWKAPAGRALVALLDKDMESLPQPEPVMSIIHCTNAQFGDILKPSRNVLVTDINPRYDGPKAYFKKNVWAMPQSVVKIVAPNDSVFEAYIKEEGANILHYFLATERNRQIEFNKAYINSKALRDVEQMFGIQIDIPTELSKISKGKDFYWITNDQAQVRKDLVIYSYPYTDKNTFTTEFLIAKRDSVMKANIPGEFEGSYMGTELKYATPVFREINVNGTYCAEVTGLWKMFKGGSMGGPFYSHTRVDEVNKRVITVEGFVFAPGTKKRNHIRQLEAVIYTLKLPQEMNVIKEVSVVADKKK